jgi:hypothetical protein
MHLAIFGDTVKSHFPTEQARQSALILFGNGKFDLTKRPLGLFARLNVFAIFGAAKIVVPPGTQVLTDGIALFGAATVRADSEVGPEIHVRYLALFGAVEIVEGKAAPLPLPSGRVFPY